MAIYEYGATVTLDITAAVDADVDLLVTAPSGATSTPTATFDTDTWSATVTANQYDTWLFSWAVDGVLAAQGTFSVGGPWYGTLALLRRRVNRSNTSADDLLASALASAARQIEQYCDGRVFWLADTGTARMFPTRRALCTADGYRLPIDDMGVAPTVVEVGDGATWTALTDAVTWPYNALAKGEAATALVSQTDWSRYRMARVTARWGWPSVPSQVAEAGVMQAQRLYSRRNSPEGVAGSSEWGVVRVPHFDPDVKALLAPYVNQFRVA